MINDQDHYEAYYADKLWNLLPAVYRAQDSDPTNTNGPLREIVNRIRKHVPAPKPITPATRQPNSGQTDSCLAASRDRQLHVR